MYKPSKIFLFLEAMMVRCIFSCETYVDLLDDFITISNGDKTRCVIYKNKQAYCFKLTKPINDILQILGPGFPCGRKPHRIVGGSEAGPYSLPWQVGLVRKNRRRPFCGGTIISNRHILTAAHCIKNTVEGRY